MNVINGNKIADEIYFQIKKDLESISDRLKLGIILASDEEASQRYVQKKTQKAIDLGIEVYTRTFSSEQLNSPEILKEELVKSTQTFNFDKNMTGFLIQLPLQESIRSVTDEILELIDPKKDVDGLTSLNLGKILKSEESGIAPATVEATIEALKQTTTDEKYFEGKNTVIINNSNLIGKPLCNILVSKNASVTVLNKSSKNIKAFTQNADIVISATGQGQTFDHSYFKEGAIVIDITSIKLDGKTCGDIIVSEELERKIAWLTPVPGGIGPLTVACLMRNLVKAYKLQNN